MGVTYLAQHPRLPRRDVVKVIHPHLASNALLAIAAGRCDELSGRFLHAEEDFADLIEFADRITEMEARVLTIRSYGDDDEVFGP